DGGASWDHIGDGLDGRDVLALGQSPDGTVLAGTNHGIFALEPGTTKDSGSHWAPRNTIQNLQEKESTVIRKDKKVTVETRDKLKAPEVQGRVYAFNLSGDTWLVSTSDGLFTSQD